MYPHQFPWTFQPVIPSPSHLQAKPSPALPRMSRRWCCSSSFMARTSVWAFAWVRAAGAGRRGARRWPRTASGLVEGDLNADASAGVTSCSLGGDGRCGDREKGRAGWRLGRAPGTTASSGAGGGLDADRAHQVGFLRWGWTRHGRGEGVRRAEARDGAGHSYGRARQAAEHEETMN